MHTRVENTEDARVSAPAVSLPKGGGAFRGIGEKPAADPVSGTGRMSVPLPVSPAREMTPTLALGYDSGAGNGPFGLGWSLGLPEVSRRTETGLPRYRDAEDSDAFVLSGADELVPFPEDDPDGRTTLAGHSVRRYRPRVGADVTRIERWTRTADGDVHWRTLSADNVLNVYGRDAGSRIADPADPRRVFTWLLCETRDDRGNAVQYRYKAEDATGVDLTLAHERQRGGADDPSRTAGRYLKSVRYGNQVPLLDEQGRRPVDVTPDALRDAIWTFEIVLDYGEHDADGPTPAETRPWLCRADPFSTRRPGFELRTYRLCQRVLMFHHFPQEPGVGRDCLVAASTLAYRSARDASGVSGDARHGHPVVSLLDSVTGSGHRRRTDGPGYTSRALPPLTFTYSTAEISAEVRLLDADSRENLPAGLDEARHEWVDLDGEGLPGVLTTTRDGVWYYKPGAGDGRFGPLRRLDARPTAPLRTGAAADRSSLLTDLDGDGRLDLVSLGAGLQGFHERTADAEGWGPFTPFESVATGADDPTAQFLDLTGDGLADLLTCQDAGVVWYPSLGARGFGGPHGAPHPDEDGHGPRPLLGDRTQTLFLADMTGDGLTDLVRVRDGEVRYWPNQGYGRFGAPVVMSGAPVFDTPDRFDPRRVRLADLDGSGTTDLLYVASDGVRLWFNQAGNGFGPARRLPELPHLGRPAQVRVADLLGNGTACLVWSSPLPADADAPLRFVDLMGGTKPHLLTAVVNNMGSESHIRYAPSTRFYLADRRAGRPWHTRLPFPVHLVEQVEHRDGVRRTRFTTRFEYHHGYFDGVEREFRGFGMVEQHDTEAYEGYAAAVEAQGGAQETAAELYQPPVTTRTWFHTGAHPEGTELLDRMTGEFHLGVRYLPLPELPGGLDARELRDCVWALKGLPIRREVYGFDGSPDEEHPYTVTEHAYAVGLVQHRAGDRHAAFRVDGRATMTRHYDRDPADPRIEHSVVLRHGPHGRVERSAQVVYGRRIADPALPAEVTRDQRRLHVVVTEADHTPDLHASTPVPVHRLGVVCERRSWELTGLAPAAGAFGVLTLQELRAGVAVATSIGYEAEADPAAVRKRLLSKERTLFRDNALAPLPLGQWDSLGLVYEAYGLALTSSVVTAHYAGQITDADFSAAGYVHLDGDDDGDWWIPSGRAVYPPGDAAARFHRAIGARDAFGVETVADYDRYDLLPERVRVVQAAWNTTRVVNDYRVLAPVLLTDPNGNRSAVEFDELGSVVKSAVMGKEGAGEGDTLADPTTRVEYELFDWMLHGTPNRTRTLVKERHGTGGPPPRESYSYLDGSGGVALTKTRTAPGDAPAVRPDGTAETVHADPRWIGSGRTIVNNKGLPVKSYEPYFSPTHAYDAEEAMRTIGSTAIRTYDPLGRPVRTDLPDGTFTRTEYRQWSHVAHDPNDTVTESRWYADRGSPDPATEPEPLTDPERRSAWLAAKHAGTPTVTHLDSLGRPVFTVASYGGGATAAVRSETDLTGRHAGTFDQLGRRVADAFTGMSGAPVVTWSAERGRRRVFTDAGGSLVRMWDEHGRVFRAEYDALRRPVAAFVQPPGGAESCFQYVVHGDRHPEAAARNLLGAAHQVFDTDGTVRVLRNDFNGNSVEAERMFTRDHGTPPDWTAVAAATSFAALQSAAASRLNTGEPFTTASEHDALGRMVRLTLPDGTEIVPVYDASGRSASVSARIGGTGAPVTYLREQAYDALGRREFARFGNGLVTRYSYDPLMLRPTGLTTSASTGGPLQDLRFRYDPVGNVTEVRDGAQQTHFFANQVVEAVTRYEYDALYRLVRATGREHAGGANDTVRTDADLPAVGQLPHVNDSAAVRTYTESYEYDVLGNLTRLRHRASGDLWTRHHRYAYQDDPLDLTNRLTATSRPGDPEGGPYTATYDHDAWGNMTRLRTATPGELAWDALDRLSGADLGGGGRAHYRYGGNGERTRKVIERPGGEIIERLYLGPLEILRRRQGTAAPYFERHTLHLADDGGRVARVDVKVRDDRGSDPANPLGAPLWRYQYGNHLGSATLETDDQGRPVSYEEYHPYGTTAYRSGRPDTDLSLKRFRFAGRERDDETGLYYVGARYYAPWLGRWTSPDPAGFVSGLNLYVYCGNSPGSRIDPDGMDDHGCMLVLGQGGFIPMELEPGGCWAAVREGRIDPATLAPGSLPSAPASPSPAGPPPPRRPPPRRRARPRPPAAASGAAPATDTESAPPPAPAVPPPPPPPPAAPPDPAPGTTSIPDAPAGTDFPGEAAAGRRAFRGANPMPPGTQAQHWTKELSAAATNMDPGVMNMNMSALQSRNRLPATTLLTDPAGRGTTYTVDGGSVFGNEHKFADRHLIPEIEAQIRAANPNAHPRDVAVQAGRQARWIMTGEPGPDPTPPPHESGGGSARLRAAGVGLTVLGTLLGGYGLYRDFESGDVPMGVGDALTTAGGAAELYGLATGATVAGVSVASAGAVLGGVGLAVGSGVYAYRAHQQGDTAGVVAGLVGVAAGAALVAGVVLGAPALLIGGTIAALGVGLFHLARWLF
ncbi:SpvB/TcaC N-terminal domain-containing protein [Streptomyces sp. NPDC052610]|uniref:SpvB/TcaC N-terminal domain-containing protein n=1 Tax=Streptomyces sp. NPDC052610 TaxID=3154952 RepID=UPI0034478C36